MVPYPKLSDLLSADTVLAELTLTSALPDLALHMFFDPSPPETYAFSFPFLFISEPSEALLEVLDALGPLSSTLVLLEALRLYSLLTPLTPLPPLQEPELLLAVSPEHSKGPSNQLSDETSKKAALEALNPSLAPTRAKDVLRAIASGLSSSSASISASFSEPFSAKSSKPDSADDIHTVCVEIPVGSTNKVELDPLSLEVSSSRPLPPGVSYPFAYGFFPRTSSPDGDALDAVVFSSSPALSAPGFSPGVESQVRILGYADVYDQNGPDPKVLCADVSDPFYADIRSLDDLPAGTLESFSSFLASYKGRNLSKFALLRGYEPSPKAVALFHASLTKTP